MSCGLPDPPPIKVPLPSPDLPEAPEAPAMPDYSWGAELGLKLDGELPKVPLPSPDLPEVPEPPVPLRALPCPFDDEV